MHFKFISRSFCFSNWGIVGIQHYISFIRCSSSTSSSSSPLPIHIICTRLYMNNGWNYHPLAFILWNAAYWFPALKWSFSETVSVFIMLFLWDNAYDSLPCKNHANNSKIKAFLYRGTIPSKLGNWLWSTKDQPKISSWFNLYWKSFTNMLVYILSRTILLYYIHFAVYYLWLHNTSRKRDWIQYILTQDCNLKKKIAYFTLVPAFNLFYHLFLPKSKE